MKKSTRFALLALATGLSATAQQQGLRTEIEVDRTVVPVQRPASPLNDIRPAILNPRFATPELQITDYSKASAFANSLDPLNPAVYTGLPPVSTYRGYASLAYFPTFNARINAGYRIVSTQRTSVGIWGQWDGLSYNAHDLAQSHFLSDNRKVSSNTVDLGAHLLQKFNRRNSLSAQLDYTGAFLKSPDLSQPDSDQRNIMGFRAQAAWHGGVGALGYHVGASFDRMSQSKDAGMSPALSAETADESGAAENIFRAHAGVFGQFSRTTYIGLEAEASFLHRSRGTLIYNTLDELKHILSYGAPEHRTLSIVKLRPFFGVKGRRASMRLGLDLNISPVNLGEHVHVNPNILLDWNPAATVAVYARFSGGDAFNSMRSLYTRYGGFAVGSQLLTSSSSPVTADFGVNLGAFHGLSLRLMGSYSCVHNAAMPVIFSSGGDLTGGFLNANISGWSAGARLGYNGISMVEAYVSGHILPHSYSSATLENPDRAKAVLKAGFTLHPITGLNIKADYELRSGRHCYTIPVVADTEVIPQESRMSNLSGLNAGADYAINSSINVFLDVRNLLCRRDAVLPWLPAQGLHGLCGVSVKF